MKILKKTLKEFIKYLAKKYGKRITNFHAPAKPYQDGVSFLKQNIKNPSWIIDIGVADGTPDLTHSYPFGENNYLLIEANPHFNNYLDSIKKQYPETTLVEKCFCGSGEQDITFNINKTGHTSSSYSAEGMVEQIVVRSYTLNELAEKHKLTGPLFLKIDVEGAELDVLKGATEVLPLCEVVILETWIHMPIIKRSGDFASIVTFMKEHSFVVFDFFGGHTYKNGLLKHVDTVFVKEKSGYQKPAISTTSI